MTIARLNAKIASRGIEMVKGSGYFYFAILPGFPDETPLPESVMVPHFTHMTATQWLDCAA